ncbi:LOW QUALITY PROTEIN: hypothetical protein NC652_015176 [Populus alba x Populus x berolinensis]|nr:LOW QUALITY PROTEIN: hypothetical protein NC652_015176 [Populus alba x Populus x berolinensis]
MEDMLTSTPINCTLCHFHLLFSFVMKESTLGMSKFILPGAANESRNRDCAGCPLVKLRNHPLQPCLVPTALMQQDGHGVHPLICLNCFPCWWHLVSV